MRIYNANTKLYEDITEEELNKLISSPDIEYNYGEEVNQKIREKYSLSEELSILRQKDVKKQEYQEYFDYCEECKRAVKNV